MRGEAYAMCHNEDVTIINTPTEIKFITKYFVFVLDRLDQKWSAVKKRFL